jgi:hypothetical protein
MMIVGTGIAVNNTAACLEAVFRKKSAFIRTPKLGVRGRSVSAGKRTYGISGGGLMVMFFELLLTAYCALCLAVAIDGLRWFAIPFMAIYCAAFGYVFWLGLLEILSQRRPRFLPALR